MNYPEDYINKIIQGDCLEVMQGMPDNSVDMILCDLPYGTTACKWDTIIPFEPLWEAYKRIIKDNGAIVLTGSQPFTSKLVMSNLKMFKYEIIWEKDSPTNPFMAKIQIMKRHENICIFYNKQPTFNPQMEKRNNKNKRNNNTNNKYKTGTKGNAILQRKNIGNNEYIYPSSINKFNRGSRGKHPTQKPVALFEYLIKTYTNEGELVLDNCIGSGTTAVACKNLKRNFIGIELEEKYCKIAKDRLKQEILL